VNGTVIDSIYLSGEYLINDQFSGNLFYQRSAGNFFGSATTAASPDQVKLNFIDQRGELSILKKDLLPNTNSRVHWVSLFGYVYKDVLSFNKSSLDTVGLVYTSVHSAMIGFGNRSYLGKNISFEGIVRYSYPFLISGIQLQQNNDLRISILFSRPIGKRLVLGLGYEIGYWNYNFTDSSNSLNGNISNTDQSFKLGVGLTF